MYKKTLNLKHHEKPAKIDLQTGEFIEINDRANNIPNNKEVFESKALFAKYYEKTHQFLRRNLSHIEMSVVLELVHMSKMNTNSLEPLNDETTQLEISKIFDLDRRKSKMIFDKLFRLGVYAKFEVYKPEVPYTKYWILNPYLSFKGKIIDSDIAKLFKGTMIHKNYIKD